MEVLGRVTQHDFYHLPQYHRVEEHRLKARPTCSRIAKAIT